jgi:hypothetical protein
MTQSTTTNKPTAPAGKPADSKTADKDLSKQVDEANRTAPTDFSVLVIADEDERPTRKSSNATDSKELLQLMDALIKSWEARTEDGFGKGKSITVPSDQSKRYATMIRKAADRVNEGRKLNKDIGTNVSEMKGTGDGENGNGIAKGMTKVSFAAKPRKAYTTAS